MTNSPRFVTLNDEQITSEEHNSVLLLNLRVSALLESEHLNVVMFGMFDTAYSVI